MKKFVFQDVSVLKDIVDSVSPTIPPEWEEDSEDEEDDEEKMRRIKAQIKVSISFGRTIFERMYKPGQPNWDV